MSAAMQSDQTAEEPMRHIVQYYIIGKMILCYKIFGYLANAIKFDATEIG